jgi:serine/threonine-protein kinase RsbW
MATGSEYSVRRAGPHSFPCNTGILGDVRGTIKAFAREHGATENAADDLVLASDEVVSNVVTHAFPEPGPGDPLPEFAIWLEATEDTVTVIVRDAGMAFDQTARTSQDFDTWLARGTKGGLGLPLIRALVDDLRYQRMEAEGLNEVRLIKRIR